MTTMMFLISSTTGRTSAADAKHTLPLLKRGLGWRRFKKRRPGRVSPYNTQPDLFVGALTPTFICHAKPDLLRLFFCGTLLLVNSETPGVDSRGCRCSQVVRTRANIITVIAVEIVSALLLSSCSLQPKASSLPSVLTFRRFGVCYTSCLDFAYRYFSFSHARCCRALSLLTTWRSLTSM